MKIEKGDIAGLETHNGDFVPIYSERSQKSKGGEIEEGDGERSFTSLPYEDKQDDDHSNRVG